MISIIVAVAKNLAIGRNNELLWDIPEDMVHFRNVTVKHTVVMGEKTFHSIGKALPDRRNIVVTLDKEFSAPDCEVSHSLEEVLVWAKETNEEVFVIGGGSIYKQAFPMADKLYLTVVDDTPLDADTFFPDYSEFKKVVKEESFDNGAHKFTFLELVR